MAKPTKSATSAPARISRSPQPLAKKAKKPTDYSSEGVADHDVFLLPGSDYQVMLVITVLATVVRLFRIYQPSSVVFDEVQYVVPTPERVAQSNQNV